MKKEDYQLPPLQPIYTDSEGHKRFQKNKIVDLMYDIIRDSHTRVSVAVQRRAREKGIEIPPGDWDQFNQMMGYSVNGMPWEDNDLEDTAAWMMKHGLSEQEARNRSLQRLVDKFRDDFRPFVSMLYGVHPEDLGGSDQV